MVVVSAALTWKRETPVIPAIAVAHFVSRHTFNLAAYDIPMGPLRVGWIIVLCAIGCASLMLFDPSTKEKRVFFIIHLALALTVLAIAGAHFGPHTGVWLALAGAGALISGGLLRYR